MKIGLFCDAWGYECLMSMVNDNINPMFVAVNSDKTADSISELCKENNIPMIRNLDDVLSYDVDIIFSIGFGKILKKDILCLPKYGVINAHPAPLPKYRGRYPTLHAILNGEKEHGVTFHYMDEDIDTGDIILQKKFPIEPNATGLTLFYKTWSLIVSEFRNLIKEVDSGIIPKGIKQNEEEATYFKKELPNNGFIDLTWSEDKIDRFIRAFYFPPYEPAKIKIGTNTYRVSI